MNGYWLRFRMADVGFAKLNNQRMADKSLQALAKVVAGLGDKIALAMWFKEGGSDTNTFDVELLVDNALRLARDETFKNSENIQKMS